eukprot:scaffold29993_cov45-Isochrysis_galbana.AAC.1
MFGALHHKLGKQVPRSASHPPKGSGNDTPHHWGRQRPARTTTESAPRNPTTPHPPNLEVNPFPLL